MLSYSNSYTNILRLLHCLNNERSRTSPLPRSLLPAPTNQNHNKFVSCNLTATIYQNDLFLFRTIHISMKKHYICSIIVYV